MNPATRRQAKRIGHNRWLHAFVFVVTMLTNAMNDTNARAAGFVPTAYRISAAGDQFVGFSQNADAFELRRPRRLRAKRLELAIGSMAPFTSPTDNPTGETL